MISTSLWLKDMKFIIVPDIIITDGSTLYTVAHSIKFRVRVRLFICNAVFMKTKMKMITLPTIVTKMAFCFVDIDVMCATFIESIHLIDGGKS